MKRKLSYLNLHFSVMLFGFAGLFGKWLSLPAMVITFGRVLFAAAALSLTLGLNKKSFKLYENKDYGLSVILGILLAFHWFSFFRAVQLSTVGIALLSYSTFPLFTSLFEPLFFRERLKKTFIFLALLALAGVYLMIPEFNLAYTETKGVLWGILSGLSFSFIALGNRKLVQQNSPWLISLYLDGFACISLLPLLFFIPFSLNFKSFILLFLLGTIFTALAHTLFVRSLKHIKASYASLAASMEPVYGILFAFLLLHEIPSWSTLLGGSLILSAVVLASTAKS
ncbi:MAG TPA: DMT family transporter [Bacteroidia bacterium]|nr:DMT family transporter [Bacteroidia bacterium]HRU67337.1 DMT family transporter [Bacteroidia bacterium]